MTLWPSECSEMYDECLYKHEWDTPLRNSSEVRSAKRRAEPETDSSLKTYRKTLLQEAVNCVLAGALPNVSKLEKCNTRKANYLNKCRWDKKAKIERSTHEAGLRWRDIICFHELVFFPFSSDGYRGQKEQPRTTIIYTTEREDKIIDSERCVNVREWRACVNMGDRLLSK